MQENELAKEIEQLKQRNARVEADKAWETSLFRKVLIAILTYAVAVLLFLFLKSQRPFLDALVPTIGFILSTLSVSMLKRYWIKSVYLKKLVKK
jgi:preprotein translocase subunit SecF